MEMLRAWMMNGDLIPSARERKKVSDCLLGRRGITCVDII
jgi:hypothetical protein